MPGEINMSSWTFFSNHGHVLFCLARNTEARLRDVASDVGITERAVQKIVRDLQDNGMLCVTKNGRRNSYRINTGKRLRHELEAACTLKDLIKVVNKNKAPGRLRVAKVKVIEEQPPVKYDPSEITEKPESIGLQEKHLAQAGPVKVSTEERGQIKTKKSEKSDSKVRQQGSLF